MDRTRITAYISPRLATALKKYAKKNNIKSLSNAIEILLAEQLLSASENSAEQIRELIERVERLEADRTAAPPQKSKRREKPQPPAKIEPRIPSEAEWEETTTMIKLWHLQRAKPQQIIDRLNELDRRTPTGKPFRQRNQIARYWD